TRDEIKEIQIMQSNIDNGITTEIEKLHQLKISLRRRLSNRKGNGYFRFLGYKELANHLFGFDERGRFSNINMEAIDILKEWLKLPVDEFRKKIDSQEIKINYKLLNQFSNS